MARSTASTALAIDVITPALSPSEEVRRCESGLSNV
jgi:hypothetical protein